MKAYAKPMKNSVKTYEKPMKTDVKHMKTYGNPM